MMLRTHLAFTVLVILIFLPSVSSKVLFIIAAMVATLIPDIDTGYSTLGKMKGFRFLQFFARHRGFFHSLTFGIVVAIIFAVFWPIISLGFFVGFGSHILTDSFTKEGIRPFWPSKRTSSGLLKTGTLTETTMFIILIIVDIILFIFVVKNLV